MKPAIENTRVDMSPYGQSVFADAIDAVQAVDLAFDAMINEMDVSKMRVFLSDVLFDKERAQEVLSEADALRVLANGDSLNS